MGFISCFELVWIFKPVVRETGFGLFCFRLRVIPMLRTLKPKPYRIYIKFSLHQFPLFLSHPSIHNLQLHSYRFFPFLHQFSTKFCSFIFLLQSNLKQKIMQRTSLLLSAITKSAFNRNFSRMTTLPTASTISRASLLFNQQLQPQNLTTKCAFSNTQKCFSVAPELQEALRQRNFCTKSPGIESTKKRPWLEPLVGSDGNAVHISGLRPHKWCPDVEGVIIYNKEKTENIMVSLRNAVQNKNVGKANHLLFELTQRIHADKLIDVFRLGAEFEAIQSNVEAQEGYLRGILQLKPSDETAKRTREQILSIVDRNDDDFFVNIDIQLLKLKNLELELNEKNLNERRKKAYLEKLVFNSVAIEGNRLSEEQVTTILRSNNGSVSVNRDYQEVFGMRDALQFIEYGKFSALHTLDFEHILDLHRLILRDQSDVAGKLREEPVRIYGIPYIPPDSNEVSEEVTKFMDFIRLGAAAVESGSMHPVEYAALVHYAFVHIHPFADGNGRTSRILMNIILKEYGYPPLIIPENHRSHYFLYIQHAMFGDMRKFIRYIANRMLDTLTYFVEYGEYAEVPDGFPYPSVSFPSFIYPLS